ncbi:GFA family protein [Kiloniella laminariae]|uniref:GFA family protein n=1 Tax=Kiloniella laminariae TaxID=454162 RepID=A0ABT4LEY6_9PROT|nr:GFA family protein [Kiloniella laminariae]MCZ4279659.1 GFA family protein [Kiloniella laminariae]
MSLAEGGCLCGEVRYAVQAAPSRVTFCHCKFCQKATGSAYLVEPIFEADKFATIRGSAKVYKHKSEGSGKKVYIHFCATCGTKLYLTFERFADAVGVYGGTFDDPDWFERTGETAKHIFLEAAQRGTIIPAGINCFLAHAMTNDGTAITPQVFTEPKVI